MFVWTSITLTHWQTAAKVTYAHLSWSKKVCMGNEVSSLSGLLLGCRDKSNLWMKTEAQMCVPVRSWRWEKWWNSEWLLFRSPGTDPLKALLPCLNDGCKRGMLWKCHFFSACTLKYRSLVCYQSTNLEIRHPREFFVHCLGQTSHDSTSYLVFRFWVHLWHHNWPQVNFTMSPLSIFTNRLRAITVKLFSRSYQTHWHSVEWVFRKSWSTSFGCCIFLWLNCSAKRITYASTLIQIWSFGCVSIYASSHAESSSCSANRTTTTNTLISDY